MNTKTKKGRPDLMSKLRAKLGESDVLSYLEAVVAKAVEVSGSNVTMKVVLEAIKADKVIKADPETVFGPNTLRAMIEKYGGFGKITADSVLGQVIRIKRGAPVGSCLGLVRNPDGAKGSLTTRRHKSAMKGLETRKRNAELTAVA